MCYSARLANRLEHVNQLLDIILVIILATHFVSVYCVHPSTDISITWNLTSNPVIFGKYGELSCYIGVKETECDRRVRQWIGGRKYTSLCQKMKCSNDTKYHVKVRAPCVYTLMILNFSMDDLNCDYTCYYGMKAHRMNLQLSHTDFVSVPGVVRKIMSVKEGNIDIQMYIENVYPSPKCYASLVDRNITQFMEMKSTKNRYFFDVELKVTQPINPCRGNATIHCHFGNQKVEVLNQYIDDCKGLNTRLNTSNRRNSTDDNSERTFSTDDTRDSTLAPEDTSDNQVSNEVTYIMVGIIVTLAVVTICMIIYSWRLKLKNKREEQKGKEEDIPLRPDFPKEPTNAKCLEREAAICT